MQSLKTGRWSQNLMHFVACWSYSYFTKQVQTVREHERFCAYQRNICAIELDITVFMLIKYKFLFDI